MPLFLITDNRMHDFNRDLFVVANDKAHAIRFWQSYYEEERTEQPERVFEVNPQKRNGAIPWHSNRCREV